MHKKREVRKVIFAAVRIWLKRKKSFMDLNRGNKAITAAFKCQTNVKCIKMRLNMPKQINL